MPLSQKGRVIKAALQKEYGEKRGEKILYAGKNKGTFKGIDALVDATARLDMRLGSLAAKKVKLGKPTISARVVSPEAAAIGDKLRSKAITRRKALAEIGSIAAAKTIMPPERLDSARADLDPISIGVGAIGAGGAYLGGKALEIGEKRFNKHLERQEKRQDAHSEKMGEHLESKGWKQDKENSFPWLKTYVHPEHPGHKIEVSGGAFAHHQDDEVVKKPKVGLLFTHPTGYQDLREYIGKTFPHDTGPSEAKSDASEVILDRKRVDALADAVGHLSNRMLKLAKKRKPVIPTGKRGRLGNIRRADGDGTPEGSITTQQHDPAVGKFLKEAGQHHPTVEKPKMAQGPADELLEQHGWSPKTLDEGEGIKEWKHSTFSRHRFVTSPQSWRHTREGVGAVVAHQEYGHGKFEESPQDVQHFGDYVGALHRSHSLRGRGQHSAIEHATAARYWATPKPKEEPFFSELSPAWRDVRPAKAVKHGVLALAKGAGPKTWKAAGERVSSEVSRSQEALGRAAQEQHQARKAKVSFPNWRGVGRAGQQAFWTHKTRGEFKNVKGSLQKDSLEEDERHDADRVRSPANLKRRSAISHAMAAANHAHLKPNVDSIGWAAHALMAKFKGADRQTMRQASETAMRLPGAKPVTMKRLLGRNKFGDAAALDAIADACAALEKRMADAEQKRADGILGGLPSIAGGPRAMDLHVAKSELASATKKVNKHTARAALHEKLRNPFGSDFNTLRAQHYEIAQRGAARRLGELQKS
jgi:hypothetical protein